jgi:hypothetical protein
MTDETKEVRKPKYYIDVFGRDPLLEEGVKVTFEGEEHVAESKAELNEWLNENGARIHKNGGLAGRCFFQLPDGRAVRITKGHAQVLKVTVGVM